MSLDFIFISIFYVNETNFTLFIKFNISIMWKIIEMKNKI
jgi:hypothetical protein